ncbi:MAG: hypothetical protein HND48_10095 [Chloroflexi bacterium]|nr:hypothetical protein [Chloroflexota bacterium]
MITLQDACVPLGGSINTIRPVAFALPLIQSAQLGISIRTSSETALASSPFPQISNLFFAPSVTNGMPTTVLADLPAGATSLYLFFDYRGMRPTTVYELRVAVDGVTSTVFSLPPVRWSGGEAGLWYIGLTGQALPNGEYTFMLLVNGQVSGDPKTIQVGGGAQSRPTFRSIAFLVSTGENQAFGNGYILGRGSTVTAQFTYDNMVDGIEWAGVWYFGGQELEPRVGGQWNTGQANGSQSTSFTVPGGLLPGRYRLELVHSGDIECAGRLYGRGHPRGAASACVQPAALRRGRNPCRCHRCTACHVSDDLYSASVCGLRLGVDRSWNTLAGHDQRR